MSALNKLNMSLDDVIKMEKKSAPHNNNRTKNFHKPLNRNHNFNQNPKKKFVKPFTQKRRVFKLYITGRF